MEIRKKIERWHGDEQFLRYVRKRMIEEIDDVPENRLPDAQYEELDDGFERDERYIVPLVEYLTYRLHLAKLRRNAGKRRRGVWRVFVQVAMQGFYAEVFAKEFGPLLDELYETIMPMLHEEYARGLNDKKE